MAVIGELLFYSGSRGPSLDDVLRHQASEGLRSSIEQLPASAFERPDDQLAEEIAQKHRIAPLQVDFTKAKAAVKETKVDVSKNFDYGFSGGSVPGFEVTKTVPFTGNPEFWKLQPNPSDLNPPRGEVRGRNLRIGISVPAAQGDSAKSYIDDIEDKIKQYLQWQETQIERHNNGLRQAALPYLQSRRTRLGAASDLLKKLGG